MILGDGEAVAGGLVELFESGELVGLAGQLRPRLREQLLALADCLPVQQLGILGVLQADEAGDARHRDRLVLPPWDVSEVVDGVAAPPELLEERAQLLVERSTVVGLVELGHDLVRRRLGEELRQCRTVLHDPTERPHRAAHVDRSGVEALQRLVRLGLLGRLHHLVVHVAERAAGQEDEVDVPVDPPLVGHVVDELVELRDHLGIGEARIVGRLRRIVLRDDDGLPLLVPQLADRRHLGRQRRLVAAHAIRDHGRIVDGMEAHVDVVIDLLRSHHDRAVVLGLSLGEPGRQRLDHQVERQRGDRPRRVHAVEVPESLDLIWSRKDNVGRRHLATPRVV